MGENAEMAGKRRRVVAGAAVLTTLLFGTGAFAGSLDYNFQKVPTTDQDYIKLVQPIFRAARYLWVTPAQRRVVQFGYTVHAVEVEAENLKMATEYLENGKHLPKQIQATRVMGQLGPFTAAGGVLPNTDMITLGGGFIGNSHEKRNQALFTSSYRAAYTTVFGLSALLGCVANAEYILGFGKDIFEIYAGGGVAYYHAKSNIPITDQAKDLIIRANWHEGYGILGLNLPLLPFDATAELQILKNAKTLSVKAALSL